VPRSLDFEIGCQLSDPPIPSMANALSAHPPSINSVRTLIDARESEPMLPLSAGSFGANRLVRVISHRIRLGTLLLLGAGLVTAASLIMWLAAVNCGKSWSECSLSGREWVCRTRAMPAIIAKGVADIALRGAVSFNQVLRTVGWAFGSAVSGAVLATHMAPALHPTGGRGHGRVTGVKLEVAATGKGFQRRTARMEISDAAGSGNWRTIGDLGTPITPPLRGAQ
jgi:hypothetical protein